jgi:hypothetical protein
MENTGPCIVVYNAMTYREYGHIVGNNRVLFREYRCIAGNNAVRFQGTQGMMDLVQRGRLYCGESWNAVPYRQYCTYV